MERELLAWAAGFVDGEGCFHLQNKRYPILTVTQTELTSLERLQSLFGGRVRSVNRKKNSTKDLWVWTIHGYELVQAAASMMWPWLTVKRAQSRHVLLTARALPPKSKRSDTCRWAGCEKRCTLATYCIEHQEERARERGHICVIPDCDRGAIAKDRCHRHYRQLKYPRTSPAPSERTHCPQDHPYDEKNTYVDPRGRRNCRTCQREAKKRWERKQKKQA